MKILVTGGAGFIGSHTVDRLLEKGHSVRILDSLESPVHPNRQKPDYLPADAEFNIGDVRDREVMEQALRGCQVVFHLAAYQDYLTDFGKFAHVNDFSTAQIYEIIVKERLPVEKVVIASSQAVYGEGKYRCLTHGVQYPLPRLLRQLQSGDWAMKCPVCGNIMMPLPTDEVKTNPHNQYAVSKLAQELYGLSLGRRYGIPSVALRYSITQGPRQSFSNAYSGVLRIFTLRLLNGQPVQVFEDGNQLRDYVHIEDVVSANMLALESEKADYEAFNVGGEQGITVNDFGNLLMQVVGKRPEPVASGKFRFGDTRHIVSDTAKLRNIGWEPKHRVIDNIRDYVNWIQRRSGLSGYYVEADRVMKELGVVQLVNGHSEGW